MICCKFGGSCTAHPESLKNILKLSLNEERRIFVFSAVGKENSDDEKLTDLLIAYCKNEQSRDVIESKILTKIEKLIETTHAEFDIEKAFQTAANNFLKTGDRDMFVSRGEEWTAQIMSQYLHIPFISAEKFMFLKHGKVNITKTQARLIKLLKKHDRIVVPGFYGVENGHITLFSRGGSDVSGAIIARATNSQTYENWTDVAGIFQVNPYILKSQTIKKLSYSDLALISSHDGKVVHADCAQILDGSDINMLVRSLFDPKAPFTKISTSATNSLPYICYAQNENDVEIKICKNFNDYKVIHAKQQDLEKIVAKEYKKL